jgi:hypothetical protein
MEPPASPAEAGGGDVPSGCDADGELLPALFWDGTEDWINEDNCADFAAGPYTRPHLSST